MDTSRGIRDEMAKSYRRQIIGWVSIAVLLSAIWMYFALFPRPSRPSLMRFAAVRYTEQALCPGEPLHYEIDLHIHPGVYAIDASVWRMDPPSAALFSTPRRIVYTESVDYTLRREWIIPPEALDPVDQHPIPWAPGRYERRHAISTISRSTSPSLIAVPFEIRENCHATE